MVVEEMVMGEEMVMEGMEVKEMVMGEVVMEVMGEETVHISNRAQNDTSYPKQIHHQQNEYL